MAEAAEEPQEKKKKPIVKILLMVVGALVLVGAGAGGGLLYAKLTKPPEESPLAIVVEKKADNAGGKDDQKPKDGKDGKDAKPAEPAGKPVPSKEKFVTSYFEFPGNFTTNLKGSRRFVQISIGLATQYDKKVIENVQKHEVAIRAEVLAILGEQSEGDVVGIENRKRIQNLLKDAINKVLTDRTEFGGIEDVYITGLVMQ
ncbi:flagellar basal body-associated FliL family protein [Rhizobiales bacterium TNE-4]|nr:flagellar basal body-associated FliL family protein [Rhizobiales bacterium TNE-4]MBV1828659.1 flagellar basal body-associated FliL family protein [Rhizobiales bacterium TNE-4]